MFKCFGLVVYGADLYCKVTVLINVEHSVAVHDIACAKRAVIQETHSESFVSLNCREVMLVPCLVPGDSPGKWDHRVQYSTETKCRLSRKIKKKSFFIYSLIFHTQGSKEISAYCVHSTPRSNAGSFVADHKLRSKWGNLLG